MSQGHDRFLRHATPLSRKAALGRIFNVTRESWRLTDDPRIVRPKTLTCLVGQTAADAADGARALAEVFPRYGFHKPSASWWGADASHFHRFIVHVGRLKRPGTAVLVISSLTGLVALRFARRSGRGGASSRPRSHRQS